jgi:hypothetical protein
MAESTMGKSGTLLSLSVAELSQSLAWALWAALASLAGALSVDSACAAGALLPVSSTRAALPLDARADWGAAMTWQAHMPTTRAMAESVDILNVFMRKILSAQKGVRM